MTETIYNKNNPEKKRKPLIIITFVITFILISTFILVYSIYNLSYFQKERLNLSDDILIYFMGEKTDYQAFVEDDSIYLPLNLVREEVDPSIQWDENKKLVILTTEKDVFHFPLGKKDGYLNLEPYKFTYPLIERDSEVYLPMNPLDNYYNIDLIFHEEESVVTIYDKNKPIQQGVSTDETKLRREPKYMSPWINEVGMNEDFNILKEENGWYWVENDEGVMGYINKKAIKLDEISFFNEDKEVYQPWNPIGEPIVLTWEYATNYTVHPSNINNLKGVQVVSPTWFHLQDNGLVANSADIRYVDWAHKNDYQVWGLFSNSFEKDLTHEMLSDPELRMKVIKQLLSYADMYKLNGINLDFENVYLEDKELLVQFLRELTPLLHEMDRTVSIDVTFKSRSENWSMFYDREKIGQIVDYVIVMAYDEHWSTSPVAGSVSSIPWVEKGIKGILEEVPNEKVILGVPFYTRLWIEEEDSEGNVKVHSKTLTMTQTDSWIKDHSADVVVDEKSGQRYVEYKEDNKTFKIWIEDGYSMEKRIEIMKKYHLAGMAAWRRGFEHEEFWDVVTELINKKY